MKQEQLLEAQVRAAAMQATVTLFCCQVGCLGGGAGTGSSSDFNPEQLQSVLERLYEVSKRLTAKILVDARTGAS